MTISWVEIVSAVLGLSCVLLAGRNSKNNFWIGYVYNIFLFILFLNQHLYAAMALQPISFAINVYGHWHWTHPKEEEQAASDSARLKVGKVSKKEWYIFAAIILAGGFILGTVLNRTQDPSPWLDSYILMFTLLAQYLSARKYLECWMVWLIVNIANLTLYLITGLWAMAIVAFLYLANGIWSLIGWKKLHDNND